MISVKVDCDAKKVTARLQVMQTRSKNFRAVFDDAESMLEKANAENFSTGGLPVGGWKPRKRREVWPIMRRTGKLFNSLVNMQGSPKVITPTYAQFGTNVEYAKFHQYGTVHMPARKILFNPTAFSREVAEKAARWIVRGIQ